MVVTSALPLVDGTGFILVRYDGSGSEMTMASSHDRPRCDLASHSERLGEEEAAFTRRLGKRDGLTTPRPPRPGLRRRDGSARLVRLQVRRPSLARPQRSPMQPHRRRDRHRHFAPRRPRSESRRIAKTGRREASQLDQRAGGGKGRVVSCFNSANHTANEREALAERAQNESAPAPTLAMASSAAAPADQPRVTGRKIDNIATRGRWNFHGYGRVGAAIRNRRRAGDEPRRLVEATAIKVLDRGARLDLGSEERELVFHAPSE